ncbi:GNAT family N-acetyltransferase [Marinilabilia sp.]
METRIFTRESLQDFINSDFFDQLENIPISRQRAVSQINNPRAEDEDVLLVAQFDGNKTVGYLGVLPDYYFQNNTREKIGWLTCFWVAEDYQSLGVAANLFRRVIRAWRQNVFITNIVPWLEPVYQKTKIFQPTQYKTGFRGYMNFNLAEILPPKNNIFGKIQGGLKILDSVFNSFVNLRKLFFRWEDVDNLKIEYHTDFNVLPETLIESTNEMNSVRRGREELNWIVKHPWIIEGGTQDRNSSRYYFSSLNKRFFYQIVTFLNDSDNIEGAALICIREKNMTIPYLFCEESNADKVARFLIKNMIELRVNMVTTFNDSLSEALKRQRKYFIYSKAVKKPYFISKQMDKMEKLTFQDGDGDCAFY